MSRHLHLHQEPARWRLFHSRARGGGGPHGCWAGGQAWLLLAVSSCWQVKGTAPQGHTSCWVLWLRLQPSASLYPGSCCGTSGRASGKGQEARVKELTLLPTHYHQPTGMLQRIGRPHTKE